MLQSILNNRSFYRVFSRSNEISTYYWCQLVILGRIMSDNFSKVVPTREFFPIEYTGITRVLDDVKPLDMWIVV